MQIKSYIIKGVENYNSKQKDYFIGPHLYYFVDS